ncbi:MAG: helix-hairpin-helix domain-containing protein [Victivallaceae bacterium]|nr:helix-hairpin-helix domain-containing protein [Victivallaceae bacterium]
MKNPNRETILLLEELPNIGKAMARDLLLIGIEQPSELIGRDAFELYEKLCAISGKRHDPCVIDVFMSVIHFMEGGEVLPWWAFTGKRKQQVIQKGCTGASSCWSSQL